VKTEKRSREENGVDMNLNTACLRHTLTGMKIPWHESLSRNFISLCLLLEEFHICLGLQVCVILDDLSRMINVGGEFVHCNMENTITVIDEFVREY
jgi:hypothetical protein